MRSLVCLLLATLIYTIPTFASNSPVGPGFSKALQRNLGEQTLRVPYDVAVNGGSVGAHGLGKYLPAKAIVTQAWFYTVTQFTDSGTGTVAISCEDANNLYTATDITGITATTVTAGAATGSAASMVKGIAAPCEVTATVATAAQTAGKLIFYIRYVLAE